MLGQIALAGEPGFGAPERLAVAAGEVEQPVDALFDGFAVDVHGEKSLCMMKTAMNIPSGRGLMSNMPGAGEHKIEKVGSAIAALHVQNS
ncbi:MAG: hypothetical protein JNM42_00235 [Propionivibrio sp.]|uniref:hypothetical protein n=1 Tax=Propionivibrio sp. TaxID=2212460 RepID=UPI001A58C3B2|nr:hypothetical protein [Propionivibrio sp.]MBL8412851.1 hypothetical protein [Propionivibrio sp.]